MYVQSTKQRIINQMLHYTAMGAMTIYFIFPMIFMFISSFKTKETIGNSLSSLTKMITPNEFTLENYTYLLTNPSSNFWSYMTNSIIVTISIVFCAVIFDSLMAFALQRTQFKGKKIILATVIALIIIPFEVIAVPLLMMISKLPYLDIFGPNGISLEQGWINTRFVQILPFAARAFPIFLFYQFFRDIPKDFDEAAMMDGANIWQVWWRIIMPMSGPVIATVIILEFLFAWNQYLWPVLVAFTPDVAPTQLGLGTFFNAEGPELGRIMAYGSLITAPVLLVFLTFQKFFVRSVMGSGVKG